MTNAAQNFLGIFVMAALKDSTVLIVQVKNFFFFHPFARMKQRSRVIYFISIAPKGCDCDSIGSISFDCDSTGACECNVGFTGRTCDTCSLGFSGPDCAGDFSFYSYGSL